MNGRVRMTVTAALLTVLWLLGLSCGPAAPVSHAAGDACPTGDEFLCGKDSAGDKNGVLLLCVNGVYTLARTCGDPAT